MARWWSIPPGRPENYFLEKEFGKLNKQDQGARYDQQLLVNLFTDCMKSSIILDRDPEFRQTLREFIPKLCPQKLNSLGHIQEWPPRTIGMTMRLTTATFPT